MKLGTGDYTVTLSEWSGRVIWQSVQTGFQSVQWGRERNETTKASLHAAIRPKVAHMLEPWVHLMTIYRGETLVWHGIVLEVEVTAQGTHVTAADGSVFFKYRRVPHNRVWRQHDATQVMRTMVEDALGFADATRIVRSITAKDSRIWVTAGWTAAECMVGEVVSHLEKMGMVWTVHAGRLLIGPVAAGFTTPQITDQVFDGAFSVVKDGTEVTTDALVVGKGVWGQYDVQDTPVGLVQSIDKADGLARAEECQQQAKRLVEDAKAAPRRIVVSSGARLLPHAPVGINQLVPGVRMPMSTSQTGVTVGSTMQLTKMSVTVDDGGEKVAITVGETNVADEVTAMPDPAELDWRSPYERELAKKAHTGSGSGAPDSEEQNEVATPPA